MPTDPLRAQLEQRYSRTHINRLIGAKMSSKFLTRRLATLAVARDIGVKNWPKYATDDEMATLRAHETGRSAAPAPAPTASAPVKTRSAVPRAAKENSGAARTATPRRKGPRDKVFVVHGRNGQIRGAMFAFLRAVDLNPVEWGQAMKATGKPMPYIAETLEEAIKDVAAVVVLITPDDMVQLKQQFITRNDSDEERKSMGQARPNVLFESGMAFGRHPEKTIFVTVGRVKPFSDIGGMHVVRMADTAKKRTELVEKLRMAGAEPKTDGRTDWLDEGNFDIREEDDADNQAP